MISFPKFDSPDLIVFRVSHLGGAEGEGCGQVFVGEAVERSWIQFIRSIARDHCTKTFP